MLLRLIRGRWIAGLILAAGFATAAPAAAQPADPPAAAATEPAPITAFEAAEDAQEMGLRHLWIAYAALWLLVFAFVWRTWRREQATAAELEALRRRLAAMEERDGGG